MGIGLLGPLEVDGDAPRLAQRDRVVLTALALRPGTVLPPDVLADALWGEHPPASWAKVVQGCVVRLRKLLGPAAVVTAPHGYRLAVHADDLDHVRFERLARRAHEALAADEPDRAAYLADEGLRLWRGPPFPDLLDWEQARAEVERFTELHESVREAAVEATVRRGRGADAVAEAVRLVRDAPFRERRWGLLALAQYRAGRQQDALATLQQARTTLVEELGLDPGAELVALERAILDQDPSLEAVDVLPDPDPRCPYPGLVAYDVADAATFHGREDDVAACLRRLDAVGVLAVVGPSGIGKSSVVRAGIAATLEHDGVRVAVITPGRHPLDSLRGAVGGRDVVLVVDQLEEVLAPEVSEDERSAFLGALESHASHSRLVVSLRADRIGDLASHPGPAHLLERGLVLLGPMAAADLRRAVEGPAHEAGLRVEPGLVDVLVAEVEGEPGALPLLSHVLRATWEHREGRVLTLDGYRASGGVRHAVARTAEAAYRDLDPTARAAVRDLMLRLVTPGPDGSPMATRQPVGTLPTDPVHADAVERLLRARLLGSDGTTVGVAHEAIAAAWPRLRSWLDDDVEGQRILRHLSVSADGWHALGRPESELYRGSRLARAREWEQRAHPSLTEAERGFLDASAALADREERAAQEHLRLERRANQRLRAGLAGVAALLAVAVVASAAAVTQAGRAEDQALAADGRRLGAEAMRTDEIDRALLLAVAGLRLHDSPDTRATVLAALDRVPDLLATRRLETVATSLAVSPTTGEVGLSLPVGTTGSDGGLALHDGRSLAPGPLVPEGRGAAVVALADGRWVTSVMAEEAGTAARPALELLAADGSRARTGFGGVPDAAFVLQHLAASPDGRWVAAAMVDPEGTVTNPTAVWDVRSPGAPVAVLDLGEPAAAPAVTDDGRTLFVRTGDRLQAVALPGGRVVRTATARDLGLAALGGGIALHPDGRTLAVTGGGQTALVDAATFAPATVLESGPGSERVAWSRDGARLAVSGEEVTAWEPAADSGRPLLRQADAGGWAAFSPDGTTLYTVEFSGLLQAWDLEGARRVVPGGRLVPDDHGGFLTRWSPDRTKVALTAHGDPGEPPFTVVHDLASGRSRELDPGVVDQGFVLDLAWSPDSRRVVVTTGDTKVVVVDAVGEDSPLERRLDGTTTDGRPDGAGYAWWTPDGATLLVGSSAGRLHVLDARTLLPRRPAVQVTTADGDDPPPGLFGFTVSRDGRTVLAAGGLVDVATGARTTPATLARVNTAEWSPDGTRVFVTDQDGAVGILDARSWAWVVPPTDAHPFRGWRSTWSNDGSRVSTTADGAVGLWDGRTGEFLGSTRLGTDGDVAFSPDGRTVLVAGDDGRLLQWQVDPAAWTAAACRLANRELSAEEWGAHLGERDRVAVCRS